MRVALTGANRGLGLEFARQLAAAGHQVAASARSLDQATELRGLAAEFADLSTHTCDVTGDDSVARFAAEVESRWSAVDLVINNAGSNAHRAGLEDLDFGAMMQMYDVNALGPLRVTRAFLPLLRRGDHPKLAHVTSKMGSIADNGMGGYYAYRMSKAALNMANANLALDLQAAIPTIVLHPGWVRTDMGGDGAPLSAAESVAGMLRVIERATAAQTGQFFDHTGAVVPW